MAAAHPRGGELRENEGVLRPSALSVIACAAMLLIAGDAGARTPLVRRTTPAFDRYTRNASPDVRRWLSDHFWRMVVFSPYFDSRTEWYPNGWIYIDSYAVYRRANVWDTDLARLHPEWILRDAEGNPLFIPWGCDVPGGCPQFAGDFANPEFRRWWIVRAAQQLRAGRYRGLWIDDVNLDWRVGDAAGRFVNPIDSRTAAPMDGQSWREYFAEFMEEVRQELPEAEIVHNAVWYAGGPARHANPAVQRQISAADWMHIEHGVNDKGLTGGDGPWSLRALLAYIDSVHALGRHVVLGNVAGATRTPAALEYSLACYFLISADRDVLGDGEVASPDRWWPGFDVDLGTPLRPRVHWNGVIRRAFQRGLVLVNEPGAGRVTIDLAGSYVRVDSSIVNSVTLAGGEGAVLRRQDSPE